MNTIVLTGATGQIGGELARTLPALGRVIAFDRRSLDLSDAGAIEATLRKCRPQIIVNAAAYTQVDQAEAEPEAAMAVNAVGPRILAQEAAALNALLVHYSTDYVFDGTQADPYDEDAPAQPLNVYGRTKLAGDRAVLSSPSEHAILRTSWVYGRTGKNFALTVLRLAAERDEMRIVNDQFGAPTWSRDIATATCTILSALLERRQTRSAAPGRGIYNLAAAGSTTWYGFAQAIVGLVPPPAHKPWARLVPIPAAEYRAAAARPANSMLRLDKLRRRFGVELPDWRASLRDCLSEGRAAQ